MVRKELKGKNEYILQVNDTFKIITMSKIGKNPITIPANVIITINGNLVTVEGQKGILMQKIRPEIYLDREENVLSVRRQDDSINARALHGLTRTLLANMVKGVSEGWTKTLELVGVGYRANKQGDSLVLSVGYSHPVVIQPMPGISFNVAENKVIVEGIDKALVGQTAANIREVRKPEPYKGKGIRYEGEYIVRKQGKAGKAGK